MADDRPRGSWLRRAVNDLRCVVAVTRVLWCRTDLSVDETLQEINVLRVRYGLKEWDL